MARINFNQNTFNRKTGKKGKKGKLVEKKIDEMISEIYISVGRLNKQITKFELVKDNSIVQLPPVPLFFQHLSLCNHPRGIQLFVASGSCLDPAMSVAVSEACSKVCPPRAFYNAIVILDGQELYQVAPLRDTSFAQCRVHCFQNSNLLFFRFTLLYAKLLFSCHILPCTTDTASHF